MAIVTLECGREIFIRVNGEEAEYLFDESGEETFNPADAWEWLSVDGDLERITREDSVTVEVIGVNEDYE